jgi:hypothetical protein
MSGLKLQKLPHLLGGVRWLVGHSGGLEVFVEQLGDGGVFDHLLDVGEFLMKIFEHREEGVHLSLCRLVRLLRAKYPHAW